MTFIRGRFFCDLDCDGVFDTGETPVAGAIVRLIDAHSGEVVQTKTTDDHGNYFFRADGVYRVEFQPVDGKVFTTPNVGDDDTIDSDVIDTVEDGYGTTEVFEVIPPTGDVLNLDAGVCETSSISGTYFCDVDCDGINNDGEFIAGAEVRLLLDGQVVDTTTTDGLGNYSFEGLLAGHYVVEFAETPNKDFTQKDVGDDDHVDSDVNPDGKTDVISLHPGEDVERVDAGVCPPGSLSGRYFCDTNNNDVDDGQATDPGIEGVVVTLIAADGTEVAETTTAADGTYIFKNVDPGTYSVEFTDPTGVLAGKQLVEPNVGVDDTIDSDAEGDTTSSTIEGIVVEPGEENKDNDAGAEKLLGSIAGRYFCDTNDNDVDDGQDVDPGVDGAFVFLQVRDDSGVISTVGRTTTDGEGNYLFENLPDGEYRVIFDTVEGKDFVAPDVGGDDTIDSDVTRVNPNNGRGVTEFFDLAPGEDKRDVDAGVEKPLIETGSLSGRYFCDTDNDDVDDGQARDPGVEGVVVTLLNATGEAIASTITGDEGQYSFTGLDAGSYSVAFTDPSGVLAGKVLVTPNVGDDDTIDSDAEGDTTLATIEDITVVAGEETSDNDAGAEKVGSIAGRYFCDTNDDSIDNDEAEPPIVGARVALFVIVGDERTLVELQRTDADGRYLFENVPAGQYEVVFNGTDAEGKVFVDANVGDDDTIDSDVTTIAPNGNGGTDVFDLAPGEDKRDVDAGVEEPPAETGSISGRYFVDNAPGDQKQDCDGLDNDGPGGTVSAPIAGATVQLLNAAGLVIAETTTDLTGAYTFTDLEAGDYQVRFAETPGREFSDQNADGDVSDNIDSDVDPDTGTTDTITLAAGEDVIDVDAGACELASLGDKVFSDNDGDGIQNAGEPGVPGVMVTLTGGGADGVIGTLDDTTDTLVTNASGEYLFEGLDPGTEYKVTFSDLPNGTVFTVANNETGPLGDAGDSDADPTNGMTQIVTLAPGEVNRTLDAGIVDQLGSLSGRYFCDTNDNDVDDGQSVDPGIAGVLVTLFDADGNVVATTTTGDEGLYSFEDLTPGTYSVQFTNQNGVLDGKALVTPNVEDQTTPEGTGDEIDSDAIGDTGTSTIDGIVVTPGEETPDNDAGAEKLPGSISGRYFCDTNDNDVDDGQATDPGIAGVVVTAFDGDGNAVGSDMTDDLGNYQITGLPEGTYSVAFTDPGGVLAGKTLVTPNVGDDDAIDSDAVGDTTRSTIEDVAVVAGQDTPDNDAGAEYDVDVAIEKLVRIIQPSEPGEPGFVGDVCDEFGKPVALTFVYDTAGGNTEVNDQDGDKASSTGTVDDDGESYIVVAKKDDIDGKNVDEGKDIFFAGTVRDGGTFTASETSFNTDFGSNTVTLIFDSEAAFRSGAAALQRINYHTSCSQPIQLGDQIGTLTLTGYLGESGETAFTEPTDPVVGDYFDADDPTGPAAEIGVDTVQFLYEVRNTGQVALGNVDVTDDRLSVGGLVEGDDNGNMLLDLDEVWIYSASEIAGAGQRTNTGTVTAQGIVDGVLVGAPVTDDDPANYLGLAAPPAINVEKYVRVEGDVLQGEDVCDTLGKPISMTFAYEISGANTVVTDQDSGKASSTGAVDDDGESYIVVAKKDDIDGKNVDEGKDIFFAGTVRDGGTFTASETSFNTDFGSNTVTLIFDSEAAFRSGAAALQTINYHTSCSQPIQLGDQIGTLSLTGYEGENGTDTRDFIPGVGFLGRDADAGPGPLAVLGSQVEFTYVVTNEGGTPLGDVTLSDDRLRNVMFVGGDENQNGLLDTDESFVFTASEAAALVGLNTNTATVVGTPTDASGTPLGLPNVTDDDPANYTAVEVIAPEGDICETLGKPVALQFLYDIDGDNTVLTGQDSGKATAEGTADDDEESYIVVAKNKDADAKDVADGKDVFFADTVRDGENFTASELFFNADFGSNTVILVFDSEADFLNGASALQTMNYHTSCSQPIEIGDQIGTLTLTGYEGEDGFFFI